MRLPEPEGARSGALVRTEATRRLRLLFVGDSSAAGVGVEHQDSALAAQTCRRLANRLDATIEWTLLARSGITTREARDWLAGIALPPADILVLALGVNDVTSQREAGDFVADIKDLIDHVVPRTGVRAVILNGLPQMQIMPAVPQPLRWYAGLCALRLDLALQDFAARRPDIAYVSLRWADRPSEMAIDGYHPGPTHYLSWSEFLADCAANLARQFDIGMEREAAQ